MLIVISPAKTLDYDTHPVTPEYSIPAYLDDAEIIVARVRKYSLSEIRDTMALSERLAKLNFERFKSWHKPFTPMNSKQAILAFKGDVYAGIDAATFSESDFAFAQQHLRILSGLYGILRPLDLMQPYRLEMGRKIDNERGKNLYEFWQDRVTDGINRELARMGCRYLINLASSEYFKVIDPKRVEADIITPVFKDYKNGQYKTIGFYAKKARGRFSRFIIKERLSDPKELKNFDVDGYCFNESLSTDHKLVFTRKNRDE